ncbi:Rdx family protein [Pseudalkalibacillus sp. Hm43]
MTSLDLIPSSGGAFEVTVNGTKLYSKLETGEFPDSDQLFAEFDSLNR